MRNKNYIGLIKCPYCSHEMNSLMCEYDETILPTVGDITLCLKCGEVSEFNSEMQLIKFNVGILTVEDLMHVRHKQYYIAKMHFKDAKLQ